MTLLEIASMATDLAEGIDEYLMKSGHSWKCDCDVCEALHCLLDECFGCSDIDSW